MTNNHRDNEPDHWLARPETIRKLWIWLYGILGLVVACELVTGTAGHFGGPDEWFGFAAAFGFLACAAMVFGAKLLGTLLKRKDTYYDL